MQDTALRVKTAVLSLKRFTVAQLCEHLGLRRSQVDPVVGELKKTGLLVAAETSTSGEEAAHRPPVTLELTTDLERVRALADEIYQVRRVVSSEEDLSGDLGVLTTMVKALEFATQRVKAGVEATPVERPELQEAGRLLREGHGHLEATTFKTCLSYDELGRRGHPLSQLWGRWQRCAQLLDGAIQSWGKVAADQEPSSKGIAIATLPKLKDAFSELEKLSAALDRMEGTASYICRELLRRFTRYELCALQRIRHDGVIETVVAAGAAEEWVGLSKHRVAREPNLRDIQADIVLRQRAEVIRGYDARLDRYLYRRFEHAGLVRIFVPLVIFRNALGAIRTPAESCWQVDEAPEAPHGRLVLTLKQDPTLTPEVFGTIEAGYRFVDHDADIKLEDALEIANYVTENAELLYRHSLDYALETAIELVRDLADGDSALVRLDDEEAPSAGYMPCVMTRRGQDGRMVRFGDPQPSSGPGTLPRADGIGQPSTYEQLEELGLVRFPLNMGPQYAVAEVQYRSNAARDKRALESAWMLTKRCSQVLGAALEHDRVRDRAQQMSALNRVIMSLVAARDHTAADLGEAIVWNTHNFLAADVVTLYEFDEASKRFTGQSQLAGRLKDTDAATGDVALDDARWLVLKTPSGRVFASDVRNDPTLNGSSKKDRSPSFIQREEIQSTAAIVLKADGQRVGVLFANFRARREFNPQEQDLITRLADGCAVALKNLRLTRYPMPPAAASAHAPTASGARPAPPSELPPQINRLLDIPAYGEVDRVLGSATARTPQRGRSSPN